MSTGTVTSYNSDSNEIFEDSIYLLLESSVLASDSELETNVAAASLSANQELEENDGMSMVAPTQMHFIELVSAHRNNHCEDDAVCTKKCTGSRGDSKKHEFSQLLSVCIETRGMSLSKTHYPFDTFFFTTNYC